VFWKYGNTYASLSCLPFSVRQIWGSEYFVGGGGTLVSALGSGDDLDGDGGLITDSGIFDCGGNSDGNGREVDRVCVAM
jgi:hypothetical protein